MKLFDALNKYPVGTELVQDENEYVNHRLIVGGRIQYSCARMHWQAYSPSWETLNSEGWDKAKPETETINGAELLDRLRKGPVKLASGIILQFRNMAGMPMHVSGADGNYFTYTQDCLEGGGSYEVEVQE